MIAQADVLASSLPACARSPVPTTQIRTWLQAAFAVVLFSLIGLVYWPSLDHTPRADQWCFLVDTIDQAGFSETFAASYSYNRTRQVGPGDTHLFRPGLFALLSAEKALFGGDFAASQAVGIGLHFLAAFLALQVILRARQLLRPGPPASNGWARAERLLHELVPYVLVLFFSLNPAVVEMVIWSHINGYLLFLVLVLGSMLLLLVYFTAPAATRGQRALLLGGCWLLGLSAAFLYEAGQFYGLVLGLVLATTVAMRRQWFRGLVLFGLFAAILPLYREADRVDREIHPIHPDIALRTVLKRIRTRQSVEHAQRYVLYTAVQPFFPSGLTWSFLSRVHIPEPDTSSPLYRKATPMLVTSYLVVAAVLGLTLRGLLHLVWQQRRLVRLLILLLPLAVFAMHMALIVFGRMNMRPGPEVLSGNAYYTYIPLLACLMSLYIIWTFAAPERRRPVVGVALYAVLLGGLIVLGVYAGGRVYAINAAVAEDLRPLYEGDRWLLDFIRQHEAEPDFSFALDPASQESLESFHSLPWAFIVFKPYIDNYNPKYVVHAEGDTFTAHRYDPVRDSPHSDCRQVNADLVRVGSPYNFYYFDGWYYGVLHWDGYFRPGAGDHLYLITDRTLEGAQRQMPVRLAEMEADRQAGKPIPRRRSDAPSHDPTRKRTVQ
jgi:hypothetical protein